MSAARQETDMTQINAPLGVLTYASPEVRTHPPRTFLRMFGAAIAWVLGLLLMCVRLVILALGYTVLAGGVVVRLGFGVVAMLLLFLGGLRWDVVRSRTMRVANWVDVRTLQAVQLVRNPFVAKDGRGA
jgi:hypothetical protein